MAGMIKTLPASWYCSKPLYELERRAVFLKAWYLVGPVTRFPPSKPVDYELAQVALQICLSTDGGIDVRRVEDGRQLPHHRTSTGLVFVALSDEVVPFNEYFPGLEKLLDQNDFTRLPHRRSIEYEGNFNWKTMVDGYQECLHCQYTHRSFSVLYPPTFYAVHNHVNYSRHITDPQKPDDGLFLYFFPNCTLNLYGGGMSSFRVCPTPKPGVTRMEFDYYHEQEGDGFEKYFNFVRRVAMEDFELCEVAQANLERGVYSQGILNPVKENGVSHYQQRVRELVVSKFEAERARRPGMSLSNCGP